MSCIEITALCIIWLFLEMSSVVDAKHSKFAVVNWGLPLAGHKLNTTPIAISAVTNHIQCMTQCVKTNGCFAVNIGSLSEGLHNCEMLKTGRYYFISNVPFVLQAGWTYIGPKV